MPWLRRTWGVCQWCRTGRENLCPRSTYTGWDYDGGYAELVTAPAAFAYRIPDAFSDVAAAPLLCAGIIGYRALVRAALPPGGRLGIYEFGASAHLTAQLAITRGLRSRGVLCSPGAGVGAPGPLGLSDRPRRPVAGAAASCGPARAPGMPASRVESRPRLEGLIRAAVEEPATGPDVLRDLRP